VMMSSGVLALSSGRPGVGLVSAAHPTHPPIHTATCKGVHSAVLHMCRARGAPPAYRRHHRC
jgi:hypothetical protein